MYITSRTIERAQQGAHKASAVDLLLGVATSKSPTATGAIPELINWGMKVISAL